MIQSLALALALTVSPLAPQKEEPPPTEEQVEAAVEAIETALDGKDGEATVAAIRASEWVPHEDVTKVLGTTGRVDDPTIAAAAIDILGRIEHDSALDQLKKIYKKGKKRMGKEDAYAIEIYRALGRRGDESAIDLIAHGSLTPINYEVDKARVISLSKIRSVKTVEALMSLMNRTGPKEIKRFLQPLRVSLTVLTGQDAGPNRKDWIDWWNDNKRKLELPKAEQPIENKKMRNLWRNFWNPPEDDEERGDDDGDPPR